MSTPIGIRKSVLFGLALFCVVQFFLLVAIAIFSYHYGEDRSLTRLLQTSTEVLYYESITDAPESLEAYLSDLSPGTYELSGNDNSELSGIELHVHVEKAGTSGLSYRVLQFPEQIGNMNLIKSYSLFALLSVFLLLTIGGWTAYSIAKRISSPLESLARKLSVSDRAKVQFVDENQPQEIKLLAGTLDTAFSKINSAMERESTFARNVSHELRTPLTVIRTALEPLDKGQHEANSAALARARIACDEMELLTGACLALAQNTSEHLTFQPVDMSTCIKQVVRESLHLLDGKSVELDVSIQHEQLRLAVQESLVRLVAGNVIRNAFIHCSDGEIKIELSKSRLIVSNYATGAEISDDGDMSQQIKPPGVGLSILGQAVSRLGWRFELNVEHKPGDVEKSSVEYGTVVVEAIIHFA